MSEIPRLSDALGRLHAALSKLNLRYAVIGGVAVVLRGYDRATSDIDAVVLEADDRLEELLDELRSHGFSLRLSDGLNFARRYRVILLRADDGTEVDLSLSALPFERELIDRAVAELVGPSEYVPVASAEDLIIMKLIASRERDQDDARRLVEMNPGVDSTRIRSVVSEYAELLDDPEIIRSMEQVLG